MANLAGSPLGFCEEFLMSFVSAKKNWVMSDQRQGPWGPPRQAVRGKGSRVEA